jgi:SAM-dependent methyltransferase
MNASGNEQFVYSGRDNLVAMRAAVNYNRHLMDLVERNAPVGASKWLDFGAGEGQFAQPFMKAGRPVLAVEVDRELVSALRAKGVETCEDLSLVPDGSIDYIYSLNVLEHIEHDVEILAALRKKLRPGGRIFIYVPAFQSLYSEMDRLVGHHRRYTRRSLERAAMAAGLKPLRSRYVDCVGFVAAGVYKLLPGTGGTITTDAVAAYDRLAFPVSARLDAAFGALAGKNVCLLATV